MIREAYHSVNQINRTQYYFCLCEISKVLESGFLFHSDEDFFVLIFREHHFFKRKRGAPKTRYVDKFFKVGSIFWRKKALNPDKWKELGRFYPMRIVYTQNK